MSIGAVHRATQAYASQGATAATRVRETPASGAASFTERMESAVSAVNESQLTAEQLLAELGSAENVDIHGTMIAMETAEISLRTMVSVRDKAVAAYEQIMNMAI